MREEQPPESRSAITRASEARERAALQRERFYELVEKALDALPDEFKERLDNLEIVVAEWPTSYQLAKTGIRNRFGLMGLYEGIPHTRRGHGYGMVLPDKITVFRKPIEARCRSWQEVEREVHRVVRHEIAHHFGTDEHTLRTIEGGWQERQGGEGP